MAFVQKRVTDGSGGFGEALRELRELRGYSRDDVSRATGIHLSILTAFEEERLEELIDPCYAERHVKTVVRLLEGRPTYFLEKYRLLLDARQIRRDDATMLPPERVRSRDLFVGSRAVAFLGFLCVLALVAGYVIWQTVLLASSPVLDVRSPTDGERLTAPRVHVEGTTDPAASVTVNGASAVVDSAGTFRIDLDVPRGLTTLTIEARRRFGSPSSISRLVLYEREGLPTDFPSMATSSVSATTTTSTVPQ